MTGANTPAMIKTMTIEVESKNLIVASMHACAESPALACRPRSVRIGYAQPQVEDARLNLSNVSASRIAGVPCGEPLESAAGLALPTGEPEGPGLPTWPEQATVASEGGSLRPDHTATGRCEAILERLAGLYPAGHPVHIVLSPWREGMRPRVVSSTVADLAGVLEAAHVGTTLVVAPLPEGD